MAEALPHATHFAKLAEEGASVKRLFAVIRSRGAAWNDSLPLEEQEDWRPHADFMNALHAEGFVVIGGPLEGTRDALLIFRASDADEIASRLEDQHRPWYIVEHIAQPAAAFGSSEPSRSVHGAIRVVRNRSLPLHGSSSKRDAISSASLARKISRASRVPSSGPPITTKPSACRAFMKSACGRQSSCSSSGNESFQAAPRDRMTATKRFTDAPSSASLAKCVA